MAANGDVIAPAITDSGGVTIDVFGDTAGKPCWFRFYADVAADAVVYLTFGGPDAADVTAPSTSATSGASCAIRIPGGTSREYVFSGIRRYAKATLTTGADAGNIVVERVGEE